MSKNNIKLKLLFPTVLKTVVLFPCVSHFWTQYKISYIMMKCIHSVFQQARLFIRSEEERSLTLHSAGKYWPRVIRWFIWKEAEKRTAARGTLSALSSTSCSYFSLFTSDKEVQILESACLCGYPSPAALITSACDLGEAIYWPAESCISRVYKLGG